MKNIVMGILAILLTGIVAFCCGYPTTVLLQMALVVLTVVLYYGGLVDVFVTKWGHLKEQKWYYWTMLACVFVGTVISLLSIRLGSRLWVWIGWVIVLVGALLNYLFNIKSEQK